MEILVIKKSGRKCNYTLMNKVKLEENFFLLKHSSPFYPCRLDFRIPSGVLKPQVVPNRTIFPLFTKHFQDLVYESGTVQDEQQ